MTEHNEWRRKEFSKKTKDEAWRLSGGICEHCRIDIQKGKEEYDHRIPCALGGSNKVDNCQVLCTACHKQKTRKDIIAISKAKRLEAARLGTKKPTKFKIKNGNRKLQSRGFDKMKKADKDRKQFYKQVYEKISEPELSRCNICGDFHEEGKVPRECETGDGT